MAGSLRALLVTLLVLPAVTFWASPSSAQDGPQSPPAEGRANGRPERVVIDGKTNPEAVNKDLLIAMVVGGMAIPASATPRDEQRLHLMAASIGFSKQDEQRLRTEMIRLHAVITPIQEQIQAHRPGGLPGVPIAELQAYLEARLQSYGRLLEILSKDGRDKLNAFIEKQVANTKVITTRQP